MIETVSKSSDPELKDNLLEHHDFEAINSNVYEHLVNWYGCDYDIPKLLRPDPTHPNKLYLELYPKKLKQKANNTKHMRSSSSGEFLL